MRHAFSWLRRRGRLLLRELAILVISLALGLGYSLWRSDAWLPSLEGNVYSVLALGDDLFMVLSNGDRNTLVRMDHEGTLLNYMDTAAQEAFQDLESDGETVYAILSREKDGVLSQSLVSLSLKDAAMRSKVLAELGGDAPPGVTWREIYLAAETEGAVLLSGVDEEGQGYLARWDPAAGRARFEKILPGESILFLKYVEPEHYVWINQEKEVGQYQNGVWQRNILAGLSDTPFHISTCGARCFLSDSVSGDIFELLQDGSSLRQRRGVDPVGRAGVLFRELSAYTTYLNPDGEVRIVGLCAGGDGSVIAGEDWSIRALRYGGLRPLMLWSHGWEAALAAWVVLSVLVESVYLILRSPRLSVRLLLCEVMAAAALLTGVIAIQYDSFQETVREEAYQKLRLIGGSLAASLTSGGRSDSGAVDLAVGRLEEQVRMAMTGHEKEYEVCVIWDTGDGPVIASDSAFPEGYLLEDVKPREYSSVVLRALRTGGTVLERIQTDTRRGYLYAQSFTQGDRTGCVAVSQSETAMLAGHTQFLQRLLPIAIACPILFLALAWITRGLLRPLDEIRRALEAFYTHGSGGQMLLDHMPRTELYEVGRVFNQLSVQTKIQMNELHSINDAYARLAPDCLLRMLRKRSVTQLRAGDHAPVPGGLLILIPRDFSAGWESLNHLAGLASEPIAQSGGMLVDYDEGLSSLTALFPQADHARDCALRCLDELERGGVPVMAAVLEETVELGVFGGEHLLYPLAVSKEMRRKQAVLERVLAFGPLLVRTGAAGRTDLRLLGWDGEMELYEDPACRPSDWQSRWQEADGAWGDALRLFREMDFPAAMRRFAKVLRLMPEDQAARWYLFRCEALREADARAADTGLLFDWEEPGYE